MSTIIGGRWLPEGSLIGAEEERAISERNARMREFFAQQDGLTALDEGGMHGDLLRAAAPVRREEPLRVCARELGEAIRRHRRAEDAYHEAAKKADPSGRMSRSSAQERMSPSIPREVEHARRQLDGVLVRAEAAARRAELEADAAALRGTAPDDGTYQRDRLQAALSHRMIADDVLFGRGSVESPSGGQAALQSKVPVFRPADELRMRLVPGEADAVAGRGRRTVAVQPVIYCPEAFHGRLDLFNAAAMVRHLDGGLVRSALGATSDRYRHLRVMETSDTEAWASQLFWAAFVDMMSDVGPFTDERLVTMIDLPFTDDVPVRVVDGWPDYQFMAEGDDLTFADMDTLRPELGAHMIGGGTQVTHKQLHNSWFAGMGALDIILRKHYSRIAYKFNEQATVGDGTGSNPTGLIAKGAGSGQIKAGNAANVIADAVTAAQPTGKELVALLHKLKSGYRAESPMVACAFMGGPDAAEKLKGGLTEDRWVDHTGVSWLDGDGVAFTPRRADDSAHCAMRVAGVPFIENGHMADLAAGSDTGLAVGAWKTVAVRRGDHFSAMEIPGGGSMHGGNLDMRLASWMYMAPLAAQNNGLDPSDPGAIVLADAR